MMTTTQSMPNDTVQHAKDVVRRALLDVSFIENIKIKSARQGVIDFMANVRVGRYERWLACMVQPKTEPKHARHASLQLANQIEKTDIDATGLIVAPYLSESSRSICNEHNVGYIDFEGNIRCVLDGIFIEREVSSKPPPEKRKLRALFKPKSSRVLKALLQQPKREWRILDLAREAKVSPGHVSNVGRSLLDREVASKGRKGLFVHDPERLLEEWQREYVPPSGQRLQYYTRLYGDSLTKALASVMEHSVDGHNAALTSFSAAEWQAPYAMANMTSIYATKSALPRLKESLDLMHAPMGANVDVTLLETRDILDDVLVTQNGIVCTSALQTYLDLTARGERGVEAALFLKSRRLDWTG